MDLRNRHEFDCRRYIKPGDRIQFESSWAPGHAHGSSGHKAIIYAGTAVKACEQFIFVKLQNVTECVNRWDIRSVNNKRLSNGCFRHFEAIR